MARLHGMRVPRGGFLACYLSVFLITAAGVVAQDNSQPRLVSQGLAGYISMDVPAPPDDYGYGVSLYATAWPLLERPLRDFQIGLASIWIVPENRKINDPLLPTGTVARDHWPERGPSYRDVFQTIEGGLGFWGSTRFGSTTAKFRMNGTANGYNHEISSPGWGFGNTTALKAEDMGIAQLSPWLRRGWEPWRRSILPSSSRLPKGSKSATFRLQPVNRPGRIKQGAVLPDTGPSRIGDKTCDELARLWQSSPSHASWLSWSRRPIPSVTCLWLLRFSWWPFRATFSACGRDGSRPRLRRTGEDTGPRAQSRR